MFFDIVASVLLPLLGLVHAWISHVYFIWPIAELMLVDYRPLLSLILVVLYALAGAAILSWLAMSLRLEIGRMAVPPALASAAAAASAAADKKKK